ncbi:MAG: RdgB/HAM1 family non-canonical purine NTP pyrophosphatase [Bacteroidetes bacterium]|nr:MAG: RdgB/HAM1 family non-canonical purine NTP pyrophosphatase [Bacteroidota bacterium]
MRLIFATNNQHKIDEIRSAIGEKSSLEIVTLKEAGIDTDIPEPYDTLERNASNKSRTIYELIKMNPIPIAMGTIGCFSEDTGLEVETLNGEPGVKSARYAGEEKSFDKNIEKLLKKLQGSTNRKARFRTIISLQIDGKEILFEGICKGVIISEKKGKAGFGYDPVFVPEGAIHTFAEMSLEEKNLFSHRKKAIDKLVAYLSKEGFSDT